MFSHMDVKGGEGTMNIQFMQCWLFFILFKTHKNKIRGFISVIEHMFQHFTEDTSGIEP